MRALMKSRPAPGAEMMEVEKPKMAPDDVLVRVKAASVCGTDLHIFRWDDWAASRIKTPLVFGHECAGEVVEVGSRVEDIPIGAHVSVETHIACGHCYQCRTGREHLCSNVKIVGVDRAGAFAEYLAVPARNVWINDAALPWEIATILEPFGNAVHAVQVGDGVTGKTVLVSGCGPIGIMAVAAARAQGALAIYASDINDYRLKIAKEMGPNDVFNAAKTDVYAEVMDRTGGEGVDVLLEMSGAPSAVEMGFRALKNGGSVALLGLPSTPMKFDLTEHIIFKGARVYGVFGRRMFQTWYQVKALVQSGSVDLKKVITHYYPLDRFDEAIKTLESGSCGKLVFRM
jgi:threonine 3-dehydrogenase